MAGGAYLFIPNVVNRNIDLDWTPQVRAPREFRQEPYLLVWAVILFLLFLLLRYIYYQIAAYFSPERRIQRDINIALHYMQEGQINDALHIFAKHNLSHEIDRCLRESLPRGEVKELLVSASEQLLKLKRLLGI